MSSTSLDSSAVADARSWMTMQSFSFELGLGATSPCPQNLGMPCIREDSGNDLILPSCCCDDLPPPSKFPAFRQRFVSPRVTCLEPHSAPESSISECDDVVALAASFASSGSCSDHGGVPCISPGQDQSVRSRFRKCYHQSVGMLNEQERNRQLEHRPTPINVTE